MAENPIFPNRIFREYIGSGPDTLNDFPGEIINPNISEFHFMLAFAVDTYSNGNGTGTFIPTWNENFFSPENIRNLKKLHKNVKVVISIGGRGRTYPFIPSENENWINSAENSLNAIIDRYHNLIDGIDVKYEYINTSAADFAHCICELLNRLVRKHPTYVVSISPSACVLCHYTKLFNKCRDIIHLVDYQFYDESMPSRDYFVCRFKSLLHLFPREKLLAGFSTDPKDAGECMIELDDFLEGCISLITQNLLRGIFIWNANYSAVGVPPFIPPFVAEIRAQKILVG